VRAFLSVSGSVLWDSASLVSFSTGPEDRHILDIGSSVINTCNGTHYQYVPPVDPKVEINPASPVF
jgi:hypothetical protein